MDQESVQPQLIVGYTLPSRVCVGRLASIAWSHWPGFHLSERVAIVVSFDMGVFWGSGDTGLFFFLRTSRFVGMFLDFLGWYSGAVMIYVNNTNRLMCFATVVRLYMMIASPRNGASMKGSR